MCHTTPKSKNSRNSGKNCATKTKINDYSPRSHGYSLGSGLVTPGCYSLPVDVPAATEGSGAGGVDAAGTAAEIPPPREDVAAGTVVVAAGTAAEIPPPREDVATAAEVAAAPDENMGGMPPPRGAADAAGVAAGKPPPCEDVATANGVGAAPDENMGGMPPPRGADAAGVAAGKPPSREDVVAANGVGAASDENMGGMPPPTRSC